MSIDPLRFPAQPRRVRRTLADRLRLAVLALSDDRGTVLSHTEQPWASITFAGSRHRLKLVFEGSEEMDAGELLVAELPEHEFTLPGQLVAHATVTGVEHTMLPEPRLVVECEILLLEER